MNLYQWTVFFPSLLLLALPASAVGASGDQVRFEKFVIDADSWYEPTDQSLRQWQKHPIRKIEFKGDHFDDFANLAMDVNGDGAAAGALAIPCCIPASALGRDRVVVPSERILLGGIGIGARGVMLLAASFGLPDVQFVAACDVDEE